MPKDRGDEHDGKEDRVRIKPELLEEVLKEYRGPEDVEEIFKQFKKAVLERALGAELTQPWWTGSRDFPRRSPRFFLSPRFRPASFI
jgi:hypothetical protein